MGQGIKGKRQKENRARRGEGEAEEMGAWQEKENKAKERRKRRTDNTIEKQNRKKMELT